MVRTWLVIGYFHNSYSRFHLRTNQRKPNMLALSERMSYFWLAHLQLPQANGTPIRLPWSFSFSPLGCSLTAWPALLRLCQNSDCGWLPVCSKLWVHSLFLSSCSWPSRISTGPGWAGNDMIREHFLISVGGWFHMAVVHSGTLAFSSSGEGYG